MALLSLTLGAVVASLVALWWARRHGTAEDTSDADLGLQRRVPWRDAEAGARSQERRARAVTMLAQRRPSRRARPQTAPSWTRLGVWGATPQGTDGRRVTTGATSRPRPSGPDPATGCGPTRRDR